jgi:hypothetical protein
VRELKALLRSAINAGAADQMRAEREAQARLLRAMAGALGKQATGGGVDQRDDKG